MREIDKKCAVALYESRDFKGGNTVVTSEGIWLHGNQIVRINPEGNLKDSTLVQFTLCGFNTPLTTSRINAVLEVFEGNMSLRRFRGETYLVDHMDNTEMIIDPNKWYYTKVEV